MTLTTGPTAVRQTDATPPLGGSIDERLARLADIVTRLRGGPAKATFPPRPEWRNGRRSGLKIRRGQPRASSTLASGTPFDPTTQGLDFT